MRHSSFTLARLAAPSIASLALLPSCARPVQLTRPASAPLAYQQAAVAASAPPARVVTPVDGSREGVRRLVDSLVSRPEWRNSQWGILIVDPERGDTLYALNPGKLFMPASNQKLLTGAVARPARASAS